MFVTTGFNIEEVARRSNTLNGITKSRSINLIDAVNHSSKALLTKATTPTANNMAYGGLGTLDSETDLQTMMGLVWNGTVDPTATTGQMMFNVPVNKQFCNKPFPRIKFVVNARKAYYTVGTNPVGSNDDLTLVFEFNNGNASGNVSIAKLLAEPAGGDAIDDFHDYEFDVGQALRDLAVTDTDSFLAVNPGQQFKCVIYPDDVPGVGVSVEIRSIEMIFMEHLSLAEGETRFGGQTQ